MDKNKEAVALTADYQTTFKTPHGKRVLRDLLKKTGFMELNYSPGDPYATAFNEGGRNVALYITKRMKLNVAQLAKQLMEVEDDED